MNVECPLCSRQFSSKTIEAHASSCDGSPAIHKNDEPRNAFTILMAGGSGKKRIKSSSLTREYSVDDDSKVICLDDDDDDQVASLSNKGTSALNHKPENSSSRDSQINNDEVEEHTQRDVSVLSNLPSAFEILMSRNKKKVEATATAKPLRKDLQEIIDGENENDDTVHEEVESTKSRGPSAFALMMSASAELSKPEYLVFDFATGICEWTETFNKDANDISWKSWVKLGKGSSQSKVMLVAKNLETSNFHSISCEPQSRLTVGTLKSVMQKSFRRRDSTNCVKASCELVVKSWRDFVRRVPIVLLEDGIASRSFAGTVWIMLADSVGLPPSPMMVHFLLDSVKQACEGKLLDWSGTASSKEMINRGELRQVTCSEDAALIFAIKARAIFGGMGGDVQMCKEYARLWFERLTHESSQKKWKQVLDRQWCFSKDAALTKTNSSSLKLEGFSSNPIPFPSLASIDSHCQPNLFNEIPVLHGVNIDQIRSAMWHFRGGLNFRKPLRDNVSDLSEPSEGMLIKLQESAWRREKGIIVEGDELYGDAEMKSLAGIWSKVASDCDRISKLFLLEMFGN